MTCKGSLSLGNERKVISVGIDALPIKEGQRKVRGRHRVGRGDKNMCADWKYNEGEIMGGNAKESEADRHQRRETQERMTKKQLFFQKLKTELLYDLTIPLLGGLKVGI